MSVKGFKSHPYIPNSVPEVEQEMLREIGLTSLEELHEEVPDEIILKENMDLPEAFGSEYELRRHVEKLLKKNSSCADNLNFLGAGCYQHYVPAICDEINGKGEFLTAYGGESYNDFGRFQSLFEYESMMAELLDMEVVNVPTMDYSQAAATAIRMGSRVAGRTGVLVPASMDREKLAVVKNYCTPDLQIEEVKCDDKTGCIDVADLKAKLNDSIGVVYFENPNYFGGLEISAREIANAAHDAGARAVRRRRRPHLPRRCGRAPQLRRRHRLRRPAAARHPHELRRRPVRLHGHDGRPDLRSRIPLPPLRYLPHQHRGRVCLRRRCV